MLVYELQRRPLPGTKLSVIDDTQGEELYLGVREDWKPLVMALNGGIDSVTESEKASLNRNGMVLNWSRAGVMKSFWTLR